MASQKNFYVMINLTNLNGIAKSTEEDSRRVLVGPAVSRHATVQRSYGGLTIREDRDADERNTIDEPAGRWPSLPPESRYNNSVVGWKCSGLVSQFDCENTTAKSLYMVGAPSIHQGPCDSSVVASILIDLGKFGVP